MSTNSRLVALYYKESIFYGFSNSLEQGLQQPQPQLMQLKCKGPKPTFKFGSIYLLDELLHLNDDVFFYSSFYSSITLLHSIGSDDAKSKSNLSATNRHTTHDGDLWKLVESIIVNVFKTPWFQFHRAHDELTQTSLQNPHTTAPQAIQDLDQERFITSILFNSTFRLTNLDTTIPASRTRFTNIISTQGLRCVIFEMSDTSCICGTQYISQFLCLAKEEEVGMMIWDLAVGLLVDSWKLSLKVGDGMLCVSCVPTCRSNQIILGIDE